MKLSFILLISSVVAGSVIQKRYDHNGNGVPDSCYDDDARVTHCLDSDNKWTTFKGTATSIQTTSPSSSETVSMVSLSTSSTKVPNSSKLSSLAGVTTSSRFASSLRMSASLGATTSFKASFSPISVPTLPSPSTFATQNNTKWFISRIGYIYSSSIPDLNWDKGRTSVISGTTFWNFGDVLSKHGLKDGFSMGAAFYASKKNMLEVDMKDIKNVNGWDFAKAWVGDPPPRNDTPFWGMDTSNVVEVEPGVGVGLVWEIWRSTTGKYVDRGSGMIKVTLGLKVPIANRTGPLITGPGGLQVGLMTVLKAEGYVYVYSNGASSNFVVGRVKLRDAFDATKYEFLKKTGNWVTGIPKANDTSYGVQGHVMSNGQYSNYLKKYILFTGAYGYYMNFYTSDTPYGPWSGRYILTIQCGYGINVHPEFSPGGDHRVLYISSGAADGITMYKVEF
ncbi:hypothetical protein ONS96_004477 [Cadophora gregata f. sp. sojae]|nr:hypothetical protein ONS96_004477 [Cadophora gregata f. sp. sojae]